MNLSPFQKNKKKKQSILIFSIGLVLLIAGIVLYRTFALFEETNEYDVIKGSVPYYLDNYDVKVNFKVDGISTNQAPTRDDKKGVESITCDKGAMGSWDYFHWNFNVNSLSQTKTTCVVNFVSRYTEDILNGTDPVLKDELIPVTISNDGTVHKANIQEKWYEYGNQEWANAVILEDESIVYQDGEEIPESNIESYFVWIPRYKYKLFDMGNYEALTTIQTKQQIIDIQFGLDTTTDSDTTCKTPMESGESGTCSVGKYMTHPAFLSFQSIGMWVGKFETGYKDANTPVEAEKNENNPGAVQIKPNVYSWRGIQVANAYLTSYNYRQNLNSHMMKNTEWGAVAYLSHSSYGSHESIRFNNNNDYKTGYAAVNEPTCGFSGYNRDCNKYGTDNSTTRPWNTDIGVLASTTGNISGVYDMSGGSWEYMMGVMLSKDNQTPCSGKNSNENSGFNGPYCDVGATEFLDNKVSFPEQKYYDTYKYGINYQGYQRRILGDATGEMGSFGQISYETQQRQISSWYKDEAYFVSTDWSWQSRGSFFNRGTGAGVFAFDRYSGFSWQYISYRVVISL